jgi:hypothetical protein
MARIHILGASGTGTTTLGKALADRLNCPHFDADRFYWLPTDFIGCRQILPSPWLGRVRKGLRCS